MGDLFGSDSESVSEYEGEQYDGSGPYDEGGEEKKPTNNKPQDENPFHKYWYKQTEAMERAEECYKNQMVWIFLFSMSFLSNSTLFSQ